MNSDKDSERVLKALANRRRIAIVKMLKRGKPVSVGAIAEEIKLSLRATSKHLSVLTMTDILERDQHGPNVFYRLASGMPTLARTVLLSL